MIVTQSEGFLSVCCTTVANRDGQTWTLRLLLPRNQTTSCKKSVQANGPRFCFWLMNWTRLCDAVSILLRQWRGILVSKLGHGCYLSARSIFSQCSYFFYFFYLHIICLKLCKYIKKGEKSTLSKKCKPLALKVNYITVHWNILIHFRWLFSSRGTVNWF